MTSYLSKLLTY